MSFFRAKNRAINKTVYYDNRVNGFLRSPIRTGNLFVEQNENIVNDLTIGGNLTMGGDLTAKNVRANQGNFYLDNYLLIPYGTIIQSAAVVVPPGWFLCDGASLLKANYLNLFNAIQYTYGGSGSNFNLPDIRGRVAVGSGQGSGLTNRELAGQEGVERHVLNIDEIPSHNHSSNATGGSIGLITSTGANTASTDLDNTANEPNLFNSLPALVINPNGGGQAHNNMQPFLVLNYLIKY
jgi:microcystin-dependent protein